MASRWRNKAIAPYVLGLALKSTNGLSALEIFADCAAAKLPAAAVAKYLMASLAVLRPEFDKTIEAGPVEGRIAAAAKKHGVEPPELAKWVEQLRGPATLSVTTSRSGKDQWHPR